VAGDITSTQSDEQLPTYNAYSKDGDVTAPLVFVNYGRPQDYEELARHGVSVQGAIAIVKYGTIWRGLKPKLAAEHGAVNAGIVPMIAAEIDAGANTYGTLRRLERALPQATSAAGTGSGSSQPGAQPRFCRTGFEPRRLASRYRPRILNQREDP